MGLIYKIPILGQLGAKPVFDQVVPPSLISVDVSLNRDERTIMKIAMIGTGYVGLVSGVCFSDFGHEVICVDKNPDKIQALKKGIVPIYEPGLGDLLKNNTAAGRLSFTVDLGEAVKEADAIFIAVGTPARRGDGHADLTYIYAAAEEIADALDHDAVVVIKSTVPVGTNRKVIDLMRTRNSKVGIDIASNPEFLREGAAIQDFMRPDRVVVGHESELAKAVLSDIYRPLYLRDFPLLFTDLETAEVIKYASNAFLATKISFINEMAELCEKVRANVKQVSKGMGLDKRIGDKFLHAGPGFGGSCFPKDTSALVKIGEDADVDMRIVKTVIAVNDSVKTRMVSKILSLLDGDVEGKVITVLGVTFKPETDDMRDAPSLTIIPALTELRAEIRAVDPQGEKEGRALLPASVTWMNDPYQAATGADCLMVLTEWNEFRALDLKRIADLMRDARLADLRNVFAKQSIIDAGFAKFSNVGY